MDNILLFRTILVYISGLTCYRTEDKVIFEEQNDYFLTRMLITKKSKKIVLNFFVGN